VALIGAMQLATEGRFGFLEGCAAGAVSPSSRLLLLFVVVLDSSAAHFDQKAASASLSQFLNTQKNRGLKAPQLQ
jgi:hypothetical protein